MDSLKMEVGIEDCLHIEFEYDKSAYHLQDVVIGKVRCSLETRDAGKCLYMINYGAVDLDLL